VLKIYEKNNNSIHSTNKRPLKNCIHLNMHIKYSVFMNDVMCIHDKQISIYIIRYDKFIMKMILI
jgi:hypothetical protein